MLALLACACLRVHSCAWCLFCAGKGLVLYMRILKFLTTSSYMQVFNARSKTELVVLKFVDPNNEKWGVMLADLTKVQWWELFFHPSASFCFLHEGVTVWIAFQYAASVSAVLTRLTHTSFLDQVAMRQFLLSILPLCWFRALRWPMTILQCHRKLNHVWWNCIRTSWVLRNMSHDSFFEPHTHAVSKGPAFPWMRLDFTLKGNKGFRALGTKRFGSVLDISSCVTSTQSTDGNKRPVDPISVVRCVQKFHQRLAQILINGVHARTAWLRDLDEPSLCVRASHAKVCFSTYTHVPWCVVTEVGCWPSNHLKDVQAFNPSCWYFCTLAESIWDGTGFLCGWMQMQKWWLTCSLDLKRRISLENVVWRWEPPDIWNAWCARAWRDWQYPSIDGEIWSKDICISECGASMNVLFWDDFCRLSVIFLCTRMTRKEIRTERWKNLLLFQTSFTLVRRIWMTIQSHDSFE